MTNPDTIVIWYADGFPEDPEFLIHSKATEGEVRARLDNDGKNGVAAVGQSLVMIYQLWDEHYRPAIADFLKRDKNTIKSDLFGDLRLIRQSVIHRQGKGVEDIAKCKILKWGQPGERLVLTGERYRQAVKECKKALNLLYHDCLLLKQS